MKSKFQVGDLVKSKKEFALGEGKVVQILELDLIPIIGVAWSNPSRTSNWYYSDTLQFAESPIQRMKRLYSEG